MKPALTIVGVVVLASVFEEKNYFVAHCDLACASNAKAKSRLHARHHRRHGS